MSTSMGAAVVALIIISLFFSAARGTLVNESIAINALETQGYENVEITKKAWFVVGWRGCDKNDAVKFIAIATNPRGKTVEVFVCAGWPFKGATIRSR